MSHRSYKLFLLSMAVTTAILVILETRVGLSVLAVVFLIFSCAYLASPKFLSASLYWKTVLKEKRFFWRFLASLMILSVSLFISYVLAVYVEGTSGPALPDVVLDNLDPIDFGPFAVYLLRIITAALLYFCLIVWPTKALFGLKAVSLLLVVRSITMCLTHLGLPAGRIPDEVGLHHVEFINVTKDLFFSGHVALSFMAYLLLRERVVGLLMLLGSLVLSFIVLAMHLHYTIDVVAAFFFTYGVYKIAAYLFKKDYDLHLTSPSPT